MNSDLGKSLADQVVADLLLVKNWNRAEARLLEDTLWTVQGRFEAKEKDDEHVVVPYSASADVTPQDMARWQQMTGRQRLVVAVVERDSAVSYFRMGDYDGSSDPDTSTFPVIYNQTK